MQCAKANTSESCKCICVFSDDSISAQTIQLIKQDPSVEVSVVEHPTISSNTRVLLTHSPTNGVLVLSFLATVVRVTFQSFSTRTTTSPCQCQKIFAILQKIFVLKKVKFNANICKEHTSTCEASNAVLPELVNQVDSRMTELFSLEEAMATLVITTTSTFSVITNELQETRQRYNEELKELYDLLQKNVCAHSLESGSGNIDSHMELQVSQQNRSSGDSASNQTTQSQGRSRDIPRHQTNHFPLTRLLHYFSNNLLPIEWHELRLAMSRCIPLRQRSNLHNGMGIFDELVNRKLISHQNLDLLHQIFTEVERFDYVHLIDRVKEGENSLLDQWYEDQERANDTGASNSQRVATVQEIRRSTVKEHRAEDASSFQRKQDITGGSLADQVARDLKQDIGDDQERNGTLSRRYKNSPPVSQASLTVPIQEVYGVEIDGGPRDFGRSRNGDVHVTSPVTQPQQQTRHHSENGSSHAGSNRGKQAAQGLSGGNKAETKAKLKFSCDHYDRYCHVQFSCCDKFWPCHRCHNMENTCGNGKLRSIDIKKIKCSRCQKIQEFPKERPHCEECGLKFAEYFCASCQHLTGRQCNPYHCIGCGICRMLSRDVKFSRTPTRSPRTAQLKCARME